MADDRATKVWGLVVGQAATTGDRVSVADVCAVAVKALDISGAWVTTASVNGRDNFMSVTDEISERIAELQLTLGEGPGHDALEIPGPVLTSDLATRNLPGTGPPSRLKPSGRARRQSSRSRSG
jgi:hypothetical protein